MYPDIKDKAILVTGSTRGIGRSIAKLLLDEGAIVGIHGRSHDRVEVVCRELDRNRTIAVSGDLADEGTAEAVVSSFHTAAERLDGVVNNAGGGKAIAFRGVTPEKWKNTFRVNLEAAVQVSQAAYTIMRRQRQGSIVNMASIAAHGPGKWMGADYAASKAGLVSLTKSLAFEAARLGIRVNAISPGLVETAMTEMLPDTMRKGLNIPMGRFAVPQEIARVAAFLLSEASGYITGQVLHVDGGLWMGNA
jgi:3-oxoacyl-[acyl-carrier protein] reductase